MFTQEFIKSLLHYDLPTGTFTWLERPLDFFKTARDCKAWNSRYCGKVAGTTPTGKSKARYSEVRILGERIYTHRLAYLYVTGNYPKNEIDHIDGNPLNNAFYNLRDVTRLENCKNRMMPKRNKSGVLGVYWDKRRNKWHTAIRVNNKSLFLGYFDELEEAKSVRLEAENKFNFHSNHGRT